ncbi:hypothetical protein TNCV_2258481 [Trichonephila clavipes]|nr:hypothetical protein TNCV_2258481 [Trichonephila clavipes]
MVWDVFWEFPEFGGSHRPREDIPPLTPDQSEKLIEFQKRIRSGIHKSKVGIKLDADTLRFTCKLFSDIMIYDIK